MYVAVKGGETAIAHSLDLLADRRRGARDLPELTLDQIDQQLSLAVDRVMTEGSCYDRTLAALAIKQARGDLFEAVFLLRAYRTTLPRFGHSLPIDTSRMVADRRISSTFKDVPGGQVLGPTFDYTHRLLDFSLMTGDERPTAPTAPVDTAQELPRVGDILEREGMLEPPPPADAGAPTQDITRDPLTFPAARAVRLQNLARGDEGFLLALGYSTQRGYGNNHPFVGEVRYGSVPVGFVPEELGFAIEIAEIDVTECDMVNQFAGSHDVPPQFTRGYGLAFGHSERKAMSMALVDRALRADELSEGVTSPAQDEEFVLAHSDSVEASGFVQHLKLPHYVDFQSELVVVRTLREEVEARRRRSTPVSAFGQAAE
ncbi:alpha-D-ribose 1-methylphosphonate 5-triphosphate synthase subunit PhnI [Enhydrobacter aerosaccus]|uniref:Alpha-D-ribose 1-methylphosphonate 5-triphosphate synthase subunit PhnI n=1 Tax=Enhydrobacter aerosaccus TaxID=225324 RepID=A0A1T4SG71_9HYPH|nr:carbon-phosphorus lyase complex subunit PhnI [Enhydrobacter aerosaccus]SKA27146.1 alpha-D-ribose 1-methylphosphonate 5-triphosphate synthase subunit PhnI [Enhydrobacter aerosaccus]